MNQDNRLSRALHLLLHLARDGGPLTSEVLAGSASTNPVVVRRMLGGLRERGIVGSRRGHGGGWVLTADPATVTLHDVYVALDRPTLLAVAPPAGSPECRVEAAVNVELDAASRAAEAVLLERFREVTLASLLERIASDPRRSGPDHA